MQSANNVCTGAEINKQHSCMCPCCAGGRVDGGAVETGIISDSIAPVGKLVWVQWRGGRHVLSWARTSHSKHVITMGVSAKGHAGEARFCTGTMEVGLSIQLT